MSRAHCVKLIIDYYDSVIREIDVYTEQLLETIDPNEMADENRIGHFPIKTEQSGYKSDFEQYLSPPVEPKYTPGVTRTVDYVNSIRQEMIDRVSKCQQDTLDFYHKKHKDFEIDPKQMDTDKEEELKRRLFGKSFCFVLNIDIYREIESYSYYSSKCLYKLYLIIVDKFVDQASIDFIRRYLNEADIEEYLWAGHVKRLFPDCRIMLLSSLSMYVGDCLMFSRGHQHLIDIRLDHLLAKKNIHLLLDIRCEPFTFELSPSSAFDFSNLTDLELYCGMNRWIELDSLGPFPHLRKLHLNGITIRKKHPLKSLCNLKHLVLNRVTISEQHLDLLDVMPNLEILSISENFYFEYGAKFVEFDKLDKLKTVELSRYYGSANFESFANPFVTQLKIIGREICNRPFFLFPNLEYLSISGISFRNCRKKEIDLNVERESKLETLTIEGNFDYELGSNLALHSKLKVVKILRNFVLSINPDGFKGLTQLEELCISSNSFFHSKDDSIVKSLTHLPNLKIFDLSNSLLEQLHPYMFICNPKLTHLDLSINNLVLKKGDFQTLSNLKWLSLKDNRMEKLEDGVFFGLDSLEELDLRGNDLVGTSLRQLKQLESLKIINLDSNLQEFFSDL